MQKHYEWSGTADGSPGLQAGLHLTAEISSRYRLYQR